MLCKVAAVEKGRLPWCIPLKDRSRVAQLASAVEERENRILTRTGRPSISVAIHLEVKGGLCVVDPEDFLLDLVTGGSKDAMFVAVRAGSSMPSSSGDSTPPKEAHSGSTACDPIDLSVPGVYIPDSSSAAPAGQIMSGGKGKAATRSGPSKDTPKGSRKDNGGSSAGSPPAERYPSRQRLSRSAPPLGSGAAPDAGHQRTQATARSGPSNDTPKGSRKDNGGSSAGSPPAERYPSRQKLSRSALPLGSGAAPDAGHQRTQGPAKKARASHQPRLLPRASLRSRKKAAEALILSAAMLHGTSSDQREAYAFLGELAGGAEAGRRLGDQLKTAADADEDGILVNRSGIVAICKTDETPHGYECLSRYLFGDAYPEGNRPGESVSARSVSACFVDLIRCIPHGCVDPLEKVWIPNEKAYGFKWTGQRAKP